MEASEQALSGLLAVPTAEPRELRWEWAWQLSAPPARVWPFVSDTQRVNKAIGLRPWQLVETPDPLGGSLRRASFRYLGMNVEWEEHPYEWIAPREMGVVRTYSTGPLEVLRSHVTLDPAEGGTRLVHRISVVPRGLLGALVARIEVGVKAKGGLDRLYRQIGAFLEGAQPAAFPEEPVTLVPGAAALEARAREKLVQRGFDPALVDRLEKALETAPDRELLRMRPFAYARAWGTEPVRVLRLFLHATREGLLDMTWDLVCPSCRGAKERADDLSTLNSEAHCGSCNVRFDATFDRSVEVTFRPNAGVRRVEAAEYCVGGPGNTRHVLAQRRVPPRARVGVDLELEPGHYRVRGPRSKAAVALEVEPGAAPSEPREIELGRESTPSPALKLAAGTKLRLKNPESFEQVLLVERTAWTEDVATAAFVTCQQEFRDLFASQVFKPGTRIAVSTVALLFTDLKASTAMYEKVGDAPAFALVRDHFNILFESVTGEQGAIVKTIGDAVMATFTDPLRALRAAFKMQDLMAAFNEKEKPAYPIHLKIGVHAGPCIAVNLNERLDYFGTTVNLAARIQNESAGDDIVLLESLAEQPDVRDVLAGRKCKAEPFEATLKGLSGTFKLVRVYPFVAASA